MRSFTAQETKRLATLTIDNSPQPKRKLKGGRLRKRLLKLFQDSAIYLVQLNLLLIEALLRVSMVEKYSLILHTKHSTIYFRDRQEL